MLRASCSSATAGRSVRSGWPAATRSIPTEWNADLLCGGNGTDTRTGGAGPTISAAVKAPTH